MKRLLFLLTVLLYTLDASAQQQSRNLFEFNGGMDIQISPDEHKEFWNTGGGGAFSFNRYMSDRFALTASISLNRFSIDRTKVEQYVSGEIPDSLDFLIDFLKITDGDVSVAAGRVGASYDFQLRGSNFENTNEGKVFFYTRAAAGVAYNAINDLELQLLDQSESIAGASKTSLTVEGGGGFRFYLTNSLGLSLETTLVANFLEGSTLVYLPIRLGVFFR
ncbi:MAG: hypothetical protein ACC655_10265 [Rhodothermia bacterium]